MRATVKTSRVRGPGHGWAARGVIGAATLAVTGLITGSAWAGTWTPGTAVMSAANSHGHYGHLHEVPPAARHIRPASRAGRPVARPFLVPDPGAFARQKAVASTRRPRGGPSAVVTTSRPRRRTNPLVVTPFSAPLAQETFAGGTDPRFVPPDTSVAASDSSVVEEVNDSAFIFTKGGHLLQSFDLRAFYGVTAPSETVTDPRIVWDSVSGLWFSTILQCSIGSTGKCDGTPDAVRLAVSLSPDPNPANWKVYVVDNETSGIIDDQPWIGFSSDKVVVTFNQYSSPTSFSNDEMLVIQKSDLVAAVPLPQMTSFNMNSGLNHRFGIVPAVPAPSDALGFNAFAAYHGSDALGQYASTLTITGTPAAADVSFTEAGPGINGMGTPPSASQPGAANSIATGDNRFESVTETNASLWIGATDSCTPAGDTASRACARIIQVKLAPSPTVVSDTDLAHKGEDFYYPALLASACSDILYLTYTMSSATTFPTAEVATSPIPLAPVFTSADYGSGTTRYKGLSGEKTPLRWGDYSGIAPDGSDFCSHGPWVAAEIGGTTAGQPNWTTSVGQFTHDAPLVSNITPTAGPPGTQVMISGTSFTPGSVVLFGSVPATSVSFLDGDDLAAVAPPHTPATVDVTVTTPLGTSPPTADDRFTYPVLAFTANSGAGDVTGFDTSALTPAGTIHLGGTPREIAIAPDAATAFVTDAASGAVIPVNLINHLQEPPIPTGAGASGIALTPDGHYAVVANTTAGTITRIDLTTTPPTVSGSLPVPAGPTQVAISPDGSAAYVTSFAGNAVSVVNVGSFTPGPQISLTGPWGDTVSPDGSVLWVTSPSIPGRGGVVYEISTATLAVTTVQLGQNDPHGITETPDQSKVFTADGASNAVTEIIPGSPPALGPTVPAGPGALELAATPDSSAVFVTDNGASTDTPIMTAGPAPGAPIPAGTAPYGIALTRPQVRTCPAFGLSALTLGFTPASVPARGLIVEVGDVFSCDRTAPVTIVTTTAGPSGCAAVKVPSRTFTPVIGDNPLIRGFKAPGCPGTYTETMKLKSGTTTITTATASYQVEKGGTGG
jgi:DNA-binding beta-propeller fold protein YncE